jgi:hypothetical protein
MKQYFTEERKTNILMGGIAVAVAIGILAFIGYIIYLTDKV